MKTSFEGDVLLSTTAPFVFKGVRDVFDGDSNGNRVKRVGAVDTRDNVVSLSSWGVCKVPLCPTCPRCVLTANVRRLSVTRVFDFRGTRATCREVGTGVGSY